MRQCPTCHQSTPDARFCTYCGAALVADGATERLDTDDEVRLDDVLAYQVQHLCSLEEATAQVIIANVSDVHAAIRRMERSPYPVDHLTAAYVRLHLAKRKEGACAPA